MKLSVLLGTFLLMMAVATWAPTRSSSKAPAADRNPGHLKMALINIRSQVSASADARVNKAAIQSNLDRHGYFIDKAVALGAEFVGFPELSVNGYHFSPNMTWLTLSGPEVQTLARKAAEKGLYISAGIAEVDAQDKKWNTHFVIGPDGKLVGHHHKIWLTAERGYTEKGTDHNVFEVKGVKMGICTCADGSDYLNLEALVNNGARIIYAPHANTTGGTLAGWYNFRARWGGSWDGTFIMAPTSNNGPLARVPSGGWIARLKVHAALHNHAAVYNPQFNPPEAKAAGKRWASGAWFIGPDGKTLAQMPTSTKKPDSKEYILIHNVRR